MMRRAKHVLALALVVALVLTACGGESTSLTGDEWILTTLEGAPLIAEAPITAAFTEEGQVAGTAGCNTYSGSYEVDGDSLSFGVMATTLMACPQPIMDQERSYLAALERTESYALADGVLMLYGSGESELAVYAAESQELAGTAWSVISYNTGTQAVRTVEIDTEISAVFDDAGQIAGNASCNDYSGPYVAEEGAITIGPLGATERFCEGLAEQEAQYLGALQSASAYQVRAGRLELRTADGALAVAMTRLGVAAPAEQPTE
jgi:heat shock protein HslJ